MNNFYEYQLMSNNSKEETRSLLHDLEIIKALEGQRFGSSETYKFFDPYLYDKYEGKLGGSQISQIERIILAYYEDYEKIVNQKKKNKKDYLFGTLRNSDGKPILYEETRGAKPSELTLIFKSLLLLKLQTCYLPEDELTLNKWLEYFGFINETLLDDIDSYYDSIYKDEEDGQDDKDGNSFVKALKKRKVIPDSYLRVHYRDYNSAVKDEFPLSDQEYLNLFKNYINISMRALRYRLQSALHQLHNENMIHFQEYKVGIEIGIFYNELTKEYEKGRKKDCLTPLEVNAYYEIEKKIKVELGIEDLMGYELYTNKKFVEELSEYLKVKGIKTNNSHRYFERVYTAYTISSRFTDKNLSTYLSKHRNLKNYYDKGKELLINEYRYTRVEFAKERIDVKKDKKKEYIANKYADKRKNRKELGKVYREQTELINNEAYSELGKQMAINLITRYHFDTLAPYEIPVLNEGSQRDSRFDLDLLPF